MERASASGVVDSDLIPSRVKPMTLNLVFTASLLDAQHYRDSVENKPASLLVVPLGKALSGIFYLGVEDRWPATPKRACIAQFRELTFSTFFEFALVCAIYRVQIITKT